MKRLKKETRMHPMERTTTVRSSSEIHKLLSQRVLGQEQQLAQIAPYITRYEAMLNPAGRPAGVFMLLGPTGTGKTLTTEAVSDVIHDSRYHVLRIDCAEYQMEHEVAKLLGSPPGYLGHQETKALLSQERLSCVTSAKSSLSIVLFDEIEKAAPSLRQLLLGILDKGQLRLGNNNLTMFERTLIFFTSNLGTKEMASQSKLGLLPNKVINNPLRFVRKFFSPEFLGRVDEFIQYEPLTYDVLMSICELELNNIEEFIRMRSMSQKTLSWTPNVPEALVARAGTAEFGAREIKRQIDRLVMRPATELYVQGAFDVEAVVRGGDVVVRAKAAKEVAA